MQAAAAPLRVFLYDTIWQQLGLVCKVGRFALSFPTYKRSVSLRVDKGENDLGKWWLIQSGCRAVRFHFVHSNPDFESICRWQRVKARAKVNGGKRPKAAACVQCNASRRIQESLGAD